MTAAGHLVWDLLGQPDPIASAVALLTGPGICRMCGRHSDATADAARALGTNWTDHSCWDRPDSDRVCGACLWVCSGRPPATIRMWTVVAAPAVDLPPGSEKAPWSAAGVHLTNRGNTRALIDLLASPPDGPWVASVATSGQKHVLPYALINQGPGHWTVRVEDTNVSATPWQWRHVHENALALRRLGVRDADILTGQPGPYLSTLDDLELWRHHSDQIVAHTGSPLLRLALWTITKEIDEMAATAADPAERALWELLHQDVARYLDFIDHPAPHGR